MTDVNKNAVVVAEKRGVKIYQTNPSKYSGLDFLGFLRSGETDMSTFAASQRNRSGPTVNNEVNADSP
jgi:hypothetical protein